VTKRVPVTRDFSVSSGHNMWMAECRGRKIDPRGVFFAQAHPDNFRLINVFEKPEGSGWHYVAYAKKFKPVKLPSTKQLKDFL